MVILEETLKKMGFGEDLEECQLAFKFAFLMDKKELIESVDFFDLTEEQKDSFKNYFKEFEKELE
jgi:hypothetical protein